MSDPYNHESIMLANNVLNIPRDFDTKTRKFTVSRLPTHKIPSIENAKNTEVMQITVSLFSTYVYVAQYDAKITHYKKQP